MMDTDTACARQQVMLRAKYRGDTKFERKDREEEEEEEVETEERRRGEEKRGLGSSLDTRHTHHPLLEHRC